MSDRWVPNQRETIFVERAEVVICGAGIAGLSAAYHLAVRRGMRRVVLVDERAPFTLTSDKSTECYRNWWPGPGDVMVRLMNRSIEIMEELARESGNRFQLNRRGYLYVTRDPEKVGEFRCAAEEAAGLGAGPVRVHDRAGTDYLPMQPEGFEGQPDGVDLILEPELIRRHFPFLSDRTAAVLHARRCGWLSAQQLGMYLLERARDHGVEVLHGTLEEVDTSGGRVQGVKIREPEGGRRISTDVLVNAAGPYVKEVARFTGVDLPVYSELHAKVAFKDYLGVVPRDTPLLILTDPQRLPWSEEERRDLAGSAETDWLLETFPPGAHMRPEGAGESPWLVMLWAYHAPVVEPVEEPEFDPSYPEITLRGLTRLVPALNAYLGRAPRSLVDGGYYTRTRENRPLIGALPLEGAYVLGALSGFGIMAGCAAGELLAAHVTGDALPGWAPWLLPSRYEDPEYAALLESWDDSGQL